MAWLLIEIWREIQDRRKAKQEQKWRDRLIDLEADKKISRIQASTNKSRNRLIQATAELQAEKANYIMAKIPIKEGEDNGLCGVDKAGARKTKTSKH